MPHCSSCDDWVAGGVGTGLNPRNEIGGTPIWYWNSTSYQNFTVGIDSTFYNSLVSWKQNLLTYSTTYGAAFGLVSPIYSFGHYGTYNCRHINQVGPCGPDPFDGPSYHSWCRAFDLTQVRWGNGSGPRSVMGYPPSPVPPGGAPLTNGDWASSNQTLRRRYLAVNAICLKYFKQSLNGWDGGGHHNHIHAENSKTVGVLDKTHPQTVRFVQAACNNFNGASLNTDGNWGALTTAAFNAANVAMCFNSNVFTSSTAWKAWCSMIARHGFADKALGFYKYATTNCPT